MAISVPTERVYYYECSAGRFRLTSFLPAADLKRLAAEGKIKEQALEDFPDGLDLDCTEPDFEEIERVYGYRHPYDAEELRRAFLAIFSSTQNWKGFRGSGFLPAADLEARLAPVEAVLEETVGGVEPEVATRSFAPPEERRVKTRARALRREVVQSVLEALEVAGVDPTKSLREQSFSRIRMSKGESAPEFFSKVQRHGSR